MFFMTWFLSRIKKKLIPFSIVPEIYTLIGIILFLSLSFVAYFFRVSELSTHFLLRFLTILYQILAMTGMGQMYLLHFVYASSIEVRGILGVLFFITALLNMAVFIVFMVKQSRYLSYYFRFTQLPSFFLRMVDAVSEVKDSFMMLVHRRN